VPLEEQTNPIKLYYCNPDLIWRSDFDRPRLGQGGFKAAFQSVFKVGVGQFNHFPPVLVLVQALTGSEYPFVSSLPRSLTSALMRAEDIFSLESPHVQPMISRRRFYGQTCKIYPAAKSIAHCHPCECEPYLETQFSHITSATWLEVSNYFLTSSPYEHYSPDNPESGALRRVTLGVRF
jgi:hypothetical protein